MGLSPRAKGKNPMNDGTNQIADHFADLATGGVQFTAPVGAAATWLPDGYRLVSDPNHVLRGDDCIMPALGNDWRLVSTANGGTRIGCRAGDVGPDVIYVATRQR